MATGNVGHYLGRFQFGYGIEELGAEPVIKRDFQRTVLIQELAAPHRLSESLLHQEAICRELQDFTHVNNPVHLVASHCKQWLDSTNQERLNGDNGLLLTPSIDHLFDRGFIGFEDDGTLIISPVAHHLSLERMGVRTNEVVNVGGFSAGQRSFLDFHRKSVLLKAAH